VIGDRQRFPAAIISLDAEYVAQWAAAHGRAGATVAQLAADPELNAEIQRAIDAVNERFTRAYQIKKFTVVADEWLPNSDVLTPTFKLKRRGVAARYGPEIAAMYA
jgi:long-chain acyl-CoA synthetase